MSADNWTKCPKCCEEATKRKASAMAKAKQMYGKVDAEKFMAATESARRLPNIPGEDTLREDYEIGIDGSTGGFSVSYAASCRKCGFRFVFKRDVSAEAVTNSEVPDATADH